MVVGFTVDQHDITIYVHISSCEWTVLSLFGDNTILTGDDIALVKKQLYD